ncbi:hypothetical protein [Methanoculleus sp.]|uniref:hypothetical protein n=1 Tax=Methanoculleus sp. TaxID=90427 RepID=UPI0025FEF85C|nr:hypothetical protein [Methanoculleus sp.]MCK9319672.1 hypothetical protein [Methanoculleus sp.]
MDPIELELQKKYGTGVDPIQAQLESKYNKPMVATTTPKTTPQREPDFIDKAGEFGSQAGRSIWRTLGEVSSIGEKMLQAPMKLFGAKFDEKTSAEKLLPEELIRKGETKTEKAGEVFGQTVQYLTPTGLEKAGISLATKIGSKIASGGILAKLLGLSAKMIGSGSDLAIKTALMGEDKEEVKQAGIFGAAAVPVIGTLAKFGTAVTRLLPEKLYNSMFKVAKDDLAAYYRTVANGGELNPTLAQELLERKVFGSTENMAVYSLNKLENLENAVQNFIKEAPAGVPRTVKIDNKTAYINLLETVNKYFKGTIFSPRSKEALKMLEELKAYKNDIPMKLALNIRRFLDKMRNTSSFRMDAKLAPKQEEYKVAADQLRGKLAKAGLDDLMNEERIFIQAFDAIVEDAVRRGNKNVLSLTDAILGGGGIASGLTGPALGAMAAYRAFQMPASLTGVAQGLYQAGKFGQKTILPLLQSSPKLVQPFINKSNEE